MILPIGQRLLGRTSTTGASNCTRRSVLVKVPSFSSAAASQKRALMWATAPTR
ncbi:MAG: hypothetical protein R2873_23950 [Caldilineaceae bacterium]